MDVVWSPAHLLESAHFVPFLAILIFYTLFFSVYFASAFFFVCYWKGWHSKVLQIRALLCRIFKEDIFGNFGKKIHRLFSKIVISSTNFLKLLQKIKKLSNMPDICFSSTSLFFNYYEKVNRKSLKWGRRPSSLGDALVERNSKIFFEQKGEYFWQIIRSLWRILEAESLVLLKYCQFLCIILGPYI